MTRTTPHGLGCKLLPAHAHKGLRTAPTDPEAGLALAIPASVDQAIAFDRIYNQGKLGSCVTNAGGGCGAALLVDQALGGWDPARLALYRECLQADGTFPNDDGTSLETFVEVARTHGLGAPEGLYPYSDLLGDLAAQDAPDYAARAGRVRLVNVDPIALDRRSIQWEIASGSKILFAMELHQSFEAIGADGIVPLPSGSDPAIGGHAQRGVGYGVDLDARAPDYLKTANSWGRSFGRNGYVYWPWELIEDPTVCRGVYALRALQGLS